MVAEDKREIGPRETSQALEKGIIMLEAQPRDGREYNFGRRNPPPSKKDHTNKFMRHHTDNVFEIFLQDS